MKSAAQPIDKTSGGSPLAASGVGDELDDKVFESREFSEDRAAAAAAAFSSEDGADGTKEQRPPPLVVSAMTDGTDERTTARNLSASESMSDDSRHRRKGVGQQGTNIAEKKNQNTRAQAQPGAKRGGRRCTTTSSTSTGRDGLLPSNGRKGSRQGHYEAGDLVEAEWAGSGWWYVGYVEGEATSTEKHKQLLYRVIFADGDQADVRGRDLKHLGPPGHPRDRTGRLLPQYVSVADLGSGWLHRKAKPHDATSDGAEQARPWRWGRRGKDKESDRRDSSSRRRGTAESSNDAGLASAGGVHQQQQQGQHGEKGQPGRGGDDGVLPLEATIPHRRGSMGRVDERRRRGKQAVWGGRTAPPATHDPPETGAALAGGDEMEDGDWYETGTQYALQPHLTAKQPTMVLFDPDDSGDLGVLSRREANRSGDDQQSSPPVSSGTSSHSSSHSTDFISSSQNEQQSRRQSAGHLYRKDVEEGEEELVRVVQPAEGNNDRGRRIFFVSS